MLFLLKLFLLLMCFHFFLSHPDVGAFKDDNKDDDGGTKRMNVKEFMVLITVIRWQNMKCNDLQLFKIFPRNPGHRRMVRGGSLHC